MNDVEHSAPRPSRKPLLARLQARTLLAIEGLAPAL
ncbi:putative protease involved in cellulose biosynthesis, partial [Cupriavidus sp. HMR-1]